MDDILKSISGNFDVVCTRCGETMEVSYKPTKRVARLIQQEVVKARIEELEQLEEDAWGVQYVPKPRKYQNGYTIGVKSIDERIAELSQTLKEHN